MGNNMGAYRKEDGKYYGNIWERRWEIIWEYMGKKMGNNMGAYGKEDGK